MGEGRFFRVQKMLNLKLQIAIAAEDNPPQFGDAGPAAALAAHRGLYQRGGPPAIHCIKEHPRAAIAEAECACGLGERSAGIDLLE